MLLNSTTFSNSSKFSPEFLLNQISQYFDIWGNSSKDTRLCIIYLIYTFTTGPVCVTHMSEFNYVVWVEFWSCTCESKTVGVFFFFFLFLIIFLLSQQITDLKKENFNLKLRIYFLEERMQQKFDGPTEEIYKIVGI